MKPLVTMAAAVLAAGLLLSSALVPAPAVAQPPAGASAAAGIAADDDEAGDPAAAELDALRRERQILTEELNRLRKTAAAMQVFDRRNRELETRVVELERELMLARQQSEALRQRSGQEWFVRGAGVLLLGVLCGVLLPRLQHRRTPRWSDL